MMSASSRTPSPVSGDRSSPNPVFKLRQTITAFIKAFNDNNQLAMRRLLTESRGLANYEFRRSGGMSTTKKPILCHAISSRAYETVALLLEFGAIVTEDVSYAAINNHHSPSIGKSQQIPDELYERLMQGSKETLATSRTQADLSKRLSDSNLVLVKPQSRRGSTSSPVPTYGSIEVIPRNSMVFQVFKRKKEPPKTSCCCPLFGGK